MLAYIYVVYIVVVKLARHYCAHTCMYILVDYICYYLLDMVEVAIYYVTVLIEQI